MLLVSSDVVTRCVNALLTAMRDRQACQSYMISVKTRRPTAGGKSSVTHGRGYDVGREAGMTSVMTSPSIQAAVQGTLAGWSRPTETEKVSSLLLQHPRP